MIVSWNWLKEYIDLDGLTPNEVENRLAMAGLNHEGSVDVGDDLAIDLEITSNRPDCLGHIGVAREIGVLWDRQLKAPQPQLPEGSAKVADVVKIRLDCPELCYRYTARVIHGVKIGPSPDWLRRRLETIYRPRDTKSAQWKPVNNVVDITNYVLMECGQPLHAFDLTELGGPEIIVRDALQDEEFEAIDHKTYSLEKGMCVIADTHGAVALGGVMGGADTEVSNRTTDLLIEAAEFSPVSIRGTARRLKIFSDSSYRFERGVDPHGVDWASRRCCQLILDICGGVLAEGVIDVGRQPTARQGIVLRAAQLRRILGIDIDQATTRRILEALGCQISEADDRAMQLTPPSWRSDVSREIDLVEEVSRIYGYDQIPEDAAVPMVPSHRSDYDRVVSKVRDVLTAAGIDEAMTASVVPRQWSNAFNPWTEAEPIITSIALLRGADALRRSLTPSLLEARRVNESLGNARIELFETARVYLPQGDSLPQELHALAITSGEGYAHLKGIIEALVATVSLTALLTATDASHTLLDAVKSSELRLNGELFGFLGEVAPAARKQFGLRGPTTVAELSLPALAAVATLIPQYIKQSELPEISRDLNLIVDESVRWADLAATVHSATGELLQRLQYQETYRDPKTDGAGKKRLLFTFSLRPSERTLTGQEADEIRDRVVAACQSKHAALLLG